MNANEELVRAVFRAFETVDRQGLHDMQADDFTFSALPDPHLDKAGFFEKCWPFADSHPRFTIEELFVRDDTVVVVYYCERDGGPPIRNTELFRLRDGKVLSVTVFFGPDTTGAPLHLESAQ